MFIGLFDTVLMLDLQQLVVFLVVFCHKMGVRIGPKSEVGGPKDPKMYAPLLSVHNCLGHEY